MITKQDEGKITKIVVDVIQDVMMPTLAKMHNDMATKDDIHRLETRMESMDRKLDFVTAKTYTNDTELVNHDRRIKKLEKHIAITD
jgi:hypothetical protein